MDRVRLGRALGYGTRHAAKTLAAVVEAAGADTSGTVASPEPPKTPESQQTQARQQHVIATAAFRRARTGAKVIPPNVGQGLTQLRRSVWGPLAVFSGALWLRVTGLFFGLIAFTVGAGAWRVREGWRHASQTPGGTHFWLFAAVATLFAYFAVSSFVRANLKERRAAAARS